MHNCPSLAGVVQLNCDISDAQYAADHGMCVFLLKMREYFRWERELALTASLPREELARWLQARERRWERLEGHEFACLPVGDDHVDPFDAAAANRVLVPQGWVYAAGYGRFQKPVFFLGQLERVERRDGGMLFVSSRECARELSAPPAMLLGQDIFVRLESVRRYLWEKIEEWHWRRPQGAMSRVLAAYGFTPDACQALDRMTEDAAQNMVLHEVGEAGAGKLLGEAAWGDLLASVARTPAEGPVRAVRDLLADCLTTLPALIERCEARPLHLYFATFETAHRRMFPEAAEGYERFARGMGVSSLAQAAEEGRGRWLAHGRRLLCAGPEERAVIAAGLAGTGR